MTTNVPHTTTAYYIQYGYRLYRGKGREDRNIDVIRELGWSKVESKVGGMEREEKLS